MLRLDDFAHKEAGRAQAGMQQLLQALHGGHEPERHFHHHRKLPFLDLTMDIIDVGFIVVRSGTTEDGFADGAGRLHGPELIPLRIQQQDRIDLLVFEQLCRPCRRIAAERIGFVDGPLINLVAQGADREQVRQLQQRQSIAFLPTPSQSDNTDSQQLGHARGSGQWPVGSGQGLKAILGIRFRPPLYIGRASLTTHNGPLATDQ